MYSTICKTRSKSILPFSFPTETRHNLQFTVTEIEKKPNCGSLGHRGIDITKSIIQESFTKKTLDPDVENFINEWIHCVISRYGDCIPWKLASSVHVSRPDELVHIDALYIGEESEEILRCILLVRDNLTSFVLLWPTDSATKYATVDELTT